MDENGGALPLSAMESSHMSIELSIFLFLEDVVNRRSPTTRPQDTTEPLQSNTAMAGKKAAGENSKKVAGNAKKAEAAANKKAGEDAKKSAVEAQEWSKGAKDLSKV